RLRIVLALCCLVHRRLPFARCWEANAVTCLVHVYLAARQTIAQAIVYRVVASGREQTGVEVALLSAGQSRPTLVLWNHVVGLRIRPVASIAAASNFRQVGI